MRNNNFVVKKKRCDEKKFEKDVMLKESERISQILPMPILKKLPILADYD